MPTPATSVSWRPSEPLARMTMGAEAMEAARVMALDGERRSYGLPEMAYPSLVRWVYREEIASVMVPCLASKGFVVTANSGGAGIAGPVPSEQNQAFGIALIECRAMYSIDPRLDAPPSEEQKALIYEYWSESVIPCVREQGLSMADLPSRQTWLADPQPMDDYPFGNAAIEMACPYNIPSQLWLGEG
ncbi:MAG TPA: hypothetical protein VLR88_11070 [Propionibacteriaceae bacterium]|nr:hypothetical protein [Propionibacteriaceae bacterium]